MKRVCKLKTMIKVIRRFYEVLDWALLVGQVIGFEPFYLKIRVLYY